MKKAMRRAAIPCLTYWAIEMAQFLFLNVATDQWILPGLLIFVIFRLMLWVSPFALSALCWISGLWKPECSSRYIAITNLFVLLLNVIPYFFFYLTTGSWY